MLDNLEWRKPTFSGGEGGDRVAAADAPDGGRYLRDTKDRSRPAHCFTAAERAAVALGVKNGELG